MDEMVALELANGHSNNICIVHGDTDNDTAVHFANDKIMLVPCACIQYIYIVLLNACHQKQKIPNLFEYRISGRRESIRIGAESTPLPCTRRYAENGVHHQKYILTHT